MTVLSSTTLRARLANRDDAFDISPILDWPRQVKDGTIDLRLDAEFIVFQRTRFSDIDPLAGERLRSTIRQYQRKTKAAYGRRFVLHPNELVLGSTLEFLTFPTDLMAYVIGRSSWGRVGLIIATATQINPGFRGNLTLELVNVGNIPIDLYPGVRIAQLVIHSLDVPEPVRYATKYDLQIGPGFTRIADDVDLPFLRTPRYKNVLGITGHKGAGKSALCSHLLQDRSYRLFSLSLMLRDMLREESPGPVTRAALQDFGDRLRREHGRGYLARKVIEAIYTSPELNDDSRILIDGIRNPAEAVALKALPGFQLIGVRATREKLIANLTHRGYLRSNDVPPGSAAGAIAGAERITRERFDADLERDSGRRAEDADGCGQDVEACLSEADRVLNNESDDAALVDKLNSVLAEWE